ncbi:MAG: hypothetical protein QW587_05650 [Candidatus Bathyarchaeia archaeon]
METRRAVAILAIAALLASVATILAVYPPEKQYALRSWNVLAKDYPSESVHFEVSLGAARVVLKQLDTADVIVDVDARYRAYGPQPVLQAKEMGSALYVTIKTEEPVLGLPESPADNYTLYLGRYGRPTSMRLNGRAIAATLQLEELPLKELSIDIGAGSLEIDLTDYRNPVSCSANLSVGGATLRAAGLGNLNFTDLSVKVGAAAATLDFTGDSKPANSQARVEAGVSTVNIYLPKDWGCRLSSRVLGTLNLDSTWMLVSEAGGRKEYKTSGYDEASRTIRLILDAGVATIDIQRLSE